MIKKITYIITMLCVACSLIVPLQEVDARKKHTKEKRAEQTKESKKGKKGKKDKKISDIRTTPIGERKSGDNSGWENEVGDFFDFDREEREQAEQDRRDQATPQGDAWCSEVYADALAKFANHPDSTYFASLELHRLGPTCAGWVGDLPKRQYPQYSEDYRRMTDTQCRQLMTELQARYRYGPDAYNVAYAALPSDCKQFWYGPPPTNYNVGQKFEQLRFDLHEQASSDDRETGAFEGIELWLFGVMGECKADYDRAVEIMRRLGNSNPEEAAVKLLSSQCQSALKQ